MTEEQTRLIRVVTRPLVVGGDEVFDWTYEAADPNEWRPHLDMARFKLSDPAALSGLIIGWMPNQTPTPTTYAALTTEDTLIPFEFELTATINMLLFKEDDKEGAFPMTDQQPYKLVMSWGAFATEAGTFEHQVRWRRVKMQGPC